MALFMDVGHNDVLRVGPDTYITIEYKSGSRTRMKIVGAAEVELQRNAKSAIPVTTRYPPSKDEE